MGAVHLGGPCAWASPGTDPVPICMHASIITQAAQIRGKAAAPAMTFPINSRGGGVCAVEASAGGRVSRVGARFTQDRTEQLPEGAARSVTSILH